MDKLAETMETDGAYCLFEELEAVGLLNGAGKADRESNEDGSRSAEDNERDDEKDDED